MPINDDLLRARKKVSATRPKFVRQESWRYIRLAENWRKPKGVDNKMRKQVSGVPPLVKVGYRGPKKARGLHPSGYKDKLIHNIRDLEKLDPKTDAARIGHSVGRRKRIDIVNKADALGIKVLNKGNVTQELNQKDQNKEQT
ncbi:MAG TPA: 50S ribosomal protein L32e [Thermodesulfobacteriota bacterium]